MSLRASDLEIDKSINYNKIKNNKKRVIKKWLNQVWN